MEEVYNVVRQEEDLSAAHKLEEDTSTAPLTAFAFQTKGRGCPDDSNKSAFCKHCNRTGHSSESCFAVIGYPKWWGDRPRAQSTQGRGRGSSSTGYGRGRGATVSANVAFLPGRHQVEHAN